MIDVHVQYFAVLRERAGLSHETVATAAATAAELYDELATRFELERQHTEVTALFAAVGALLLLAAASLSVLWFRRVA